MTLLPTLSVALDTLGPEGDAPLHLAALYGARLWPQERQNQRRNGRSPGTCSRPMRTGHENCVDELLKAGANAGISDEAGGTPLVRHPAGPSAQIPMLLAVRHVQHVPQRQETPRRRRLAHTRRSTTPRRGGSWGLSASSSRRVRPRSTRWIRTGTLLWCAAAALRGTGRAH